MPPPGHSPSPHPAAGRREMDPPARGLQHPVLCFGAETPRFGVDPAALGQRVNVGSGVTRGGSSRAGGVSHPPSTPVKNSPSSQYTSKPPHPPSVPVGKLLSSQYPSKPPHPPSTGRSPFVPVKTLFLVTGGRGGAASRHPQHPPPVTEPSPPSAETHPAPSLHPLPLTAGWDRFETPARLPSLYQFKPV